MKRFLPIALAFSMLLCLSTSCANEIHETTTAISTAAQTTEHSSSEIPSQTTCGTDGNTKEINGQTNPDIIGPLPGISSWTARFKDVDFGGRVFTFLTKYSGEGSEFARYDTRYEILSNGEGVISQAVKERNELVENLFNCHIEAEYTTFPRATLRLEMTSNHTQYDIFAIDYLTPDVYTDDKVYNLHNVGIDFTNPWWDENYTNTYTVTKSGTSTLYSALGASSLSAINLTYALVFNRDIYENSALAEIDIYELVRKDQWTLDTFTEMVKAFSHDENGDGNYFVSEGDRVGWINGKYDSYALFAASGLSLIKNVNGALSVAPPSNPDTWDTAIDQAIKLWNSAERETLPDKSIAEVLASGSVLFATMAFDELSALKEKSGTFDVVPYPLYSETQDHYASFVLRGFSPYVMPITVKDPAIVGKFLDIFMAASYFNTTVSAYTEKLAIEYLHNVDAAEMFDIIMKNRVYDPAYHFFTEYTNAMIKMIETDDNVLSAWNTRRAPRLTSELQTFLANIEDNEH